MSEHGKQNSQKDVLVSFEASKKRSDEIETELLKTPEKFRVLTGDRPTGPLHIGHLFGSLQNRVRLQNLGVPVYIVIADYQVLTDRDSCDRISENVKELALDYLACGLDPDGRSTFIFPHSQVPELNQLLLPFLTLVSMAELDRNPTVKEEIQAAGQKQINAGMYVYPVHQAADILACGGNLVPVGKDQLPHLELARVIARRFNDRFCKGQPLFREPNALLSEAPAILGLDGAQKMSKSRNNAIFLRASEDDTAALIKRAKSDSERLISYDPQGRPEVSNLLFIASLAQGRGPEQIAAEIGNGGSSRLKEVLTESLNEYLRPIRQRRKELERDQTLVRQTLSRGVTQARAVATETLERVRGAMNMAL